MLQRLFLAVLITALANLHVTAQSPMSFPSKVKATATATKPDAEGKQIVNVTLDIEKGWIVYANPVGFEDIEGSRAKVSFKAKEPVTADVKYPTGRAIIDDIGQQKITYHVYESQVKLHATVKRTVGDTSPLLLDICLNGFHNSFHV